MGGSASTPTRSSSYFCWEAFPVLSMRTSNAFREELRSELTLYVSLYPIKEYCFFNLYFFYESILPLKKVKREAAA